MDNNIFLRRLRYSLDRNDKQMCSLLTAGGKSMEVSEMVNLLKKEDETDYQICSDEIVLALLDGLIIKNRGPREPGAPAPKAIPLDNNLILKKLRIALNFKEEDMLRCFTLAEANLSKAELSAFFRRRDHKHFRSLGDQLLRQFLKGLSLYTNAKK